LAHLFLVRIVAIMSEMKLDTVLQPIIVLKFTLHKMNVVEDLTMVALGLAKILTNQGFHHPICFHHHEKMLVSGSGMYQVLESNSLLPR
jgi:hypothetical protein